MFLTVCQAICGAGKALKSNRVSLQAARLALWQKTEMLCALSCSCTLSI